MLIRSLKTYIEKCETDSYRNGVELTFCVYSQHQKSLKYITVYTGISFLIPNSIVGS